MIDKILNELDSLDLCDLLLVQRALNTKVSSLVYERRKPIKKGTLRQDLWSTNFEYDGKLVPVSVRDDIIHAFERSFRVTLKEGTQFVCYHEALVEQWYDVDEHGNEGQFVYGEYPEWAEQYLDIEEVVDENN